MKITDILPAYGFETKKLEYKVRLNSPDPCTWLKTIAGFANCDGGELIVGVKDDKTLHGFLENEIDGEIRNINNQIKSKIEPEIVYDFKYIPYSEGNDTRFLINIIVYRSKRLPVILKENKFNVIYLRQEAATVVASPEQIRSLIIKSEAITNDEVDTRVKFEVENFNKLFDVYEKNKGEELTLKKLESINFYNTNGYLKKGSLLFADDCNDSNTIMHCRLWDSLTKGSSVVLDDKETKGNLLELLDFALKFIMSNTKTGFIKQDIGRKSISSYPQRAVTEAVVNALVHRNYMITGAQIDIDIFKDRIEITSPGSLLGSSFKSNETDLKSIPSKRRNQLICDVFAICNLMEKSGSGFEKIMDDYASFDDRYKPSISCTNDYFVITLKDVLYQDDGIIVYDFTCAPITEGKRDRDNEILSFCLDEYKTAAEIAQYLGLNKSSYFTKQYLSPLIQNEYLLPYTDAARSSKQKYKTNRDKLVFL